MEMCWPIRTKVSVLTLSLKQYLLENETSLCIFELQLIQRGDSVNRTIPVKNNLSIYYKSIVLTVKA